MRLRSDLTPAGAAALATALCLQPAGSAAGEGPAVMVVESRPVAAPASTHCPLSGRTVWPDGLISHLRGDARLAPGRIVTIERLS